MVALEVIRQERNTDSHKLIDDSERQIETILTPTTHLLLNSSFWSLHPLITTLEVKSSGRKNYLFGRPLQGQDRFCKVRQWHWKDTNLLIDPKEVYQSVVNPEDVESAVMIPLSPLVRVVHHRTSDELWLADDPSQDQYWNPSNGDTMRFNDNCLHAWWQNKIDNIQ